MKFSEARERLSGLRLQVYDTLLASGSDTLERLAQRLGQSAADVGQALGELVAICHVAKAPGGRFRALRASEAESALNRLPSGVQVMPNGDHRGPAYYVPAPDPDNMPVRPADQQAFLFE